nr:unnamed protein product [Spirometra erinaceieuropaei]
MNGVEVFTQSNHHDGLQKLYARKRALRACLFSKTTTTTPVMTHCLDREMSGALDLLDEARAKYQQLEREWRAAVKLVSPLDPIKNFTAVVKAIKSDQERNYCWLRQILSNLPNRKHWMHFLCHLCDVEQEAALHYYQASLHEVEESARRISTIYRLLHRLRSANRPPKDVVGADNQMNLLWQSNVTCERLCYEVWLRLLELTMFLEGRQMPLARLQELPWSFLKARVGEDAGGASAMSELLRSVLQGPECSSLNDRLSKRLANGRERRRQRVQCEHGTNMSNQEGNPAENEDGPSGHEGRSTQTNSFEMRTGSKTAPSKCATATGRYVNPGDLQRAEDFSISNSTVRRAAAAADGSASTSTHPVHIGLAAMTASEDENSSNLDSLESTNADGGPACPWLHPVGGFINTSKNNFEDCPFESGDEGQRARRLWTHPKQIAAQSSPFFLPNKGLGLSNGVLTLENKTSEMGFLKSGFPQLWTERPENSKKSHFLDSIRQGSTGNKPWLLPHPRPSREPPSTGEGPIGTSASAYKTSLPSTSPLVPNGRRSRSASDVNSLSHRYRHHRLRSSFSSSSIASFASASQPCPYRLSDQESAEPRLPWQDVDAIVDGSVNVPGASSGVAESFRVRRVNSYLRAAERAEAMVRALLPLPHSYSNLDFSNGTANRKRRSISESQLPLRRPRRMARSLSVEAIRGGCFQRRPRTSSNGRSMGTPSNALSEYLSTYWDDYQAPFYSSSEAIGSPEPAVPLPPHLNWEDCFGEETEALDLENCFVQPSDFSAQILDDWSFDGPCNSLSSASLSYSSPRRSGATNSDAGSSLVYPAASSASSHREPVGDSASQVKKADKCEQTDLPSELLPSLRSVSKQAVQNPPSLDLTTTHTSGYESGPDAGDCLYQFSSDRTCDTAVQTPNCTAGVRGRNLDDHLPMAIPEEPDSSSDGLAVRAQRPPRGSEILVRSEQNLEKLRSFLVCILSGTNVPNATEDGTDETPLQTPLEKNAGGCSRATQASGCALSAALEKSFECISESTEQNISMLSSLSDDRVKECQPLESNCVELATRWKLLLAWTRRHFEDLRELNSLQSRLSGLAARSQVLSGFADRAFDGCNSLPSTAEMTQLCTESTSLLEATEVVHKSLLCKRLTGTAAVVPTAGGQQSIELQDLEAQFEAVYDNLLDSAIKHSSAVTDAVAAESTRIALLCSARTYWTNFSPNKQNEVAQLNTYETVPLSSSDEFSLIESSKTEPDVAEAMPSSSLVGTASRPRAPPITQKLLPILLPLFLLILLYIYFCRGDNRLPHLLSTQSCLGVPRWRIFSFARSSPPPQ